MAADIEQELIEKVRTLPLEKQKKVLSYAEELRQQNGGEGSRVEDLTIWEMVKDVILEVPAEAWEELPKDGSRNVDHYLYGAPKREP
jgi:hypothetical protein